MDKRNRARNRSVALRHSGVIANALPGSEKVLIEVRHPFRWNVFRLEKQLRVIVKLKLDLHPALFAAAALRSDDDAREAELIAAGRPDARVVGVAREVLDGP